MTVIDKHIFHSEVVGALIKEAVEFFEATPLEKLPLQTAFTGRGVYALYYTGKYDHYAFYAKRSTRIPIYIGKAVPQGWRQGRLTTDASAGRELFRRIKDPRAWRQARLWACNRLARYRDFARLQARCGP
jgi:hypothetical protein